MTLRDGTVIPPPDHAPAWSELGDPPAPKLSIPRLLLGVLAAVAAGVFFNFVQRPEAAPAAVATTSIFAPYVDVTLTPTYPFEDPAANPVSNVILGFIVASPSAPCTPSWGGYYSLAGAMPRSTSTSGSRRSQLRAGRPPSPSAAGTTRISQRPATASRR
jgi:chitinase